MRRRPPSASCPALSAFACRAKGRSLRRLLLVLLFVAGFAASSGVAFTSSNDLVLSIYGYRSPMKGTPPLTEDTSRPLASQVVLVIIDGLRYDSSLQMPYLNRLRQQGAHAVLSFEPPSNAQTAWTTLLSGTGPEVSDAPLFDHSLPWIAPIAVDHLFAAANRAGLRCGISASAAWAKLITPDLFYTQYFVNPSDDSADERVIEQAGLFLTEFAPAFTLIQLGQVSAAGSQFGAASHQYQAEVLRSDDHVRRVAESMSLSDGVLLVASSHGYLDSGGHGGDEPTLLRTPFVMVGKNVLPGDYGDARAIDVAPTIAAILGIPAPSSTRGNIETRMLTMDVVDRAEKLVQLASQRVRLGNMYLYSINGEQLQPTAQGDMLVAMSSLQVKNYESAAELAAISVAQTDQEMLRARDARIWKERTQRAWPIAALIALLLWMLWHNWSSGRRYGTLVAPLAAALYHILFVQQGNTYSWSDIPQAGLASTLEPSVVRAALCLSVGGLLVTFGAWRERERSASAVVMRAFGYAALLLMIIAAIIGVALWYNGPRFDWYLPDLTLAFVQFTALVQLMCTAALAVPLPIIVLLLQRVLLGIADRRSTRRVAASLPTHR